MSMNDPRRLAGATCLLAMKWVVLVAAFLLAGCKHSNELDSGKGYAVYYYDVMNKVVFVELLPPGHSRVAAKLSSPPPPLPASCDAAYPSRPVTCGGNPSCSVPITGAAVVAVYYGEGSEAESTVKAVGIESGPFAGRIINWPRGAGCPPGPPACTKSCCAPSGGGCVCIC